MALRRSKSRDGRGMPYISSPQPINTSLDALDTMNSTRIVPLPRKKSSNSILKRTASWTTDRKKERVERSSPLVRSETVSVSSSPRSMQDMAAAIPPAPAPAPPFVGTSGQRQVDLAKFGDPDFNPESCKVY
jgi:hypothetical protein